MWKQILPLLKPLLLSVVRKVVFGSGVIGLFVAQMIQSGQITEADVSSTVVFVVSLVLTAVPLLWSFTRNLVKDVKVNNIKVASPKKKKK